MRRKMLSIAAVSDKCHVMRCVQVLSFILSHTTDGPGAAVLDAALSVDSSPLKAKVSRPLLLAPIVGEPGPPLVLFSSPAWLRLVVTYCLQSA